MIPAAPNRGWTYRDRVTAAEAGRTACGFYAARHRHSAEPVWRQRLAAGELWRNGHRLRADDTLAAGDQLQWHRPPWDEPAVPGSWRLLFDDGDLHVIDKPAGLPVLPAGGYLEHTVLRLLEQRHRSDPAGVPRPVHRLGRFTSGVLVCARQAATRAWLSARLRQSTAGAEAPCRKVYRTLTLPTALPLAVGESLEISAPIGRRPHPLLGQVWCAAGEGEPGVLPARSTLTLLEHRPNAALVEVSIATGRPHQIRIHCAAVGAPLLGDPLYRPGGLARDEMLPGAGGYHLHAHRLRLACPAGVPLELEAPLPEALAQLLWNSISREK